jgi:MFS transporter, Spinster family, sphingosine-1-phosphate transporter
MINIGAILLLYKMVNISLCKLSPVMLLTLFTSVNILVFIDRGALAAVVSLLKDKDDGLDLSSFEAGSLGSVFILGYMIASPIFAYESQFIHPNYLMTIGLTVWAGAVMFSGLSVDFPMLAAARVITGVGEASFVCLAPPVILDCAPHKQRSIWIGIYSSATPLGYALGFVYGNQVSSLLGGWYYPFIIETFLMIPFILITFLSYKDPKFYAKKENGEKEKLSTQISILGRNPLYVNLVIGYSSYAFTIGGLGFWV